jgi:probable HAF family extracellular repeat protein
MTRKSTALYVLLFSTIIGSSELAWAAAFQSLGDLPGGDFSSIALGVSADGRVVVGSSNGISTSEAFRWTQDSGMVSLGDLPGRTSINRHASSTSADGSVIVGTARSSSSTGEAFRWTQQGGMVGLGTLPLNASAPNSFANSTSADGSVVVGGSNSALSPGPQAFRWTQESGMVGLVLPALGRRQSVAYDTSADGRVVVGEGGGESGTEAFRWVDGSGGVGLGHLPGGIFSNAQGISADGSVVVGLEAHSASFIEAFRWTQQGGMVGLGDLPGGNFNSEAKATSADGSEVVGISRPGGGVDLEQAFIWDPLNGMRNFQEVLINDFGLRDSLQGWRLIVARDISDDGRTIAGSGLNPSGRVEAWIVTDYRSNSVSVPEPPSLLLLGIALVGLAAWRWKHAA